MAFLVKIQHPGVIIVLPCPIAVSCASLIPEESSSVKLLLLYSIPIGRLELNISVLHRFLNAERFNCVPIVENAELHELANAVFKFSVPCALLSKHGILVPP